MLLFQTHFPQSTPYHMPFYDHTPSPTPLSWNISMILCPRTLLRMPWHTSSQNRHLDRTALSLCSCSTCLPISSNFFVSSTGPVSSSGIPLANGMGFPQGGVCSAGFWSLAFDEAVRLINTGDTLGVAFADDCAVLSGGTDPALLISRVQRTVDHLVEWGSECGLTFNPAKTQVVFFTRTCTIPPRAITVAGHPIPYRTTAQYLGLTLDRRLWWHDHVHHKTSKAKRLLNALLLATRGNWGPRPDVTKWIYTAIVRPSVS